MTILEVKDLVLSKPVKGSYGDARITILKGVTAKFESGKINAIMGANGCGKTTFLNMVYGYSDVSTKTCGQILFEKQERNITDWFWNVSYIEQESYQIEKQTGYAVIKFAIDIKNAECGTNSKIEDFKWMIDELYLTDILQRDISVLSGGERQRVLLAAELVMSKQISVPYICPIFAKVCLNFADQIN